MAPRLVVTELHVADVARSLHFYRDVLGVPFGDIERHVDDPVAHAHASWGSWRESDAFLRLNLYPLGDGAATHSVIGFVVDDLGAVHERLSRAAVEVRQLPTQKSWGRTATYVDPDGNEVLLTEVAR
jgi:predicted enzyme related to lactoylglutathione lyase